MLWFSNLSIMSELFECFEALTETARWPGSRAAWWASLTWKGWRSWWWPTLRRRRPFQLSGQMTPWQRWLLQSACGRPHSAGIINIVCLVIFRCDTWPRVEGVTDAMRGVCWGILLSCLPTPRPPQFTAFRTKVGKVLPGGWDTICPRVKHWLLHHNKCCKSFTEAKLWKPEFKTWSQIEWWHSDNSQMGVNVR